MTGAQAPIRVFLVDDHELVRSGIANLLGSAGDIEIVGEAATAAEARSRVSAANADIALLDVRLPDGSGIDVCRDIRSKNPGLRCIMLTAYDDDEAIYAAVIAGASGYILKDIRGAGLVDAVRKVAAGLSILDTGLQQRVIARMKGEKSRDARYDSLTIRERQILSLIADGMTNREIAGRLALAEKTVKNYVSGLLSKLGLQHRTQAAIFHVQSKEERNR